MTKKIAIVTGGSNGIGLAVVKELILSNVRVVNWDKSSLDKAYVKEFGNQLTSIYCNVENISQVKNAYEKTIKTVGSPDILVNSAGITGPNDTLENYDTDDWKRVIDVNLNGTFFVNKVCIPVMKEKNYGRIMNISSVAGKEGNPYASAYSAAKAAVIGLTKSLGKELAHFNISVNCITPAAARTQIFDQMSEEHISYMLSKIPRGRFLELQEAAKMITWAVSSENSFTTGAVFDLSGGRATY